MKRILSTGGCWLLSCLLRVLHAWTPVMCSSYSDLTLLDQSLIRSKREREKPHKAHHEVHGRKGSRKQQGPPQVQAVDISSLEPVGENGPRPLHNARQVYAKLCKQQVGVRSGSHSNTSHR